MAQLHNYGEEYVLEEAFGSGTAVTSVSVGLYNSTTNTLADADDVGAITSEPTGVDYVRQSAAVGTDFVLSLVAGAWQAVMSDHIYETGDAIEDVNGYFVVATFEAGGDTGATEHLLFSGDLDQLYDLSNVTQFTLQGSGLSLD